jgi:hypothetical protein
VTLAARVSVLVTGRLTGRVTGWCTGTLAGSITGRLTGNEAEDTQDTLNPGLRATFPGGKCTPAGRVLGVRQNPGDSRVPAPRVPTRMSGVRLTRRLGSR